jgi:murein DD-endopeptidase MepM/ murein hydrolase activator NlpD/phage-related protein
MPGVIDTAEVQIIPDLRRFMPELRREIDRAMREAQRSVEQSLQRIERSFDDTARNAGQSLNTVDADFRSAVAGADAAGDRIASQFSSAADASSAALEGVEGNFAAVEGAADEASEEIASSFDGAAEEADSALSSVEGDFSSVEGAADGAADGVAGAFDGAADAADASLSGIGDSGFEEVVGASDGAADAVASAFDGAADAADASLSGIGAGAFDDVVSGAQGAADEVSAAFSGSGDSMVGAADRGGGAFLGLALPIKTLAAGLAAVGFASFLKEGTLGAQELNSAIAATQTIIEATGGAAGLMAEDIRKLADELSLKIGIDDAEIQQAANVLLTFRAVSSDVFGDALGLAADLAAVLGTDLQGATLQIGKALNDPVRGINALRRAGVQFTEQQQDQIKAMVASGDVLGAQNVILDELRNQVGGVAEASADSTAKIAVAWDNLREALGGPVIAVIDKALPAIIEAIDAMKPAMSALGEIIGQVLVALLPVMNILGAALAEMLTTLAPSIQPIGIAFTALVTALAPILPLIGTIVATLLPPLARIIIVIAEAFTPLIEQIVAFIEQGLLILQPLIPAILTVVTQLAQALGEGLLQVFIALTPALLMLLEALLPLIPPLVRILEANIALIEPLLELAGIVLPWVVEELSFLVAGFAPVLEVLADVGEAVAEFIQGAIQWVIELVENWDEKWAEIKQTVSDVWNAILATITGFLTMIRDWIVARLVDIGNWFRDRWIWIRDTVTGIIDGIRSNIVGRITAVRDRVVEIFTNLRNTARDIWNTIRTWITDRVESIRTGVTNIFTKLRDGIVNIWNTVVDKIKKPIKAIFSWINDKLIDNANKVTKIFGLTIPRIPTNFHQGGVIPGTGEKMFLGLGGEGVLTPDTTRALGGERGIKALNQMGGRAGEAFGGPVDWIKENILDPAGQALAAVGDQITDWLKQGAGFAMRQLVRPLRSAIGSVLPDGFVSDFVGGIFDALTRKMEDWAEGKDKESEGATGTSAGRRGDWLFPLPAGTYRVGRGSDAHGYPARDLPAPRGTPILSMASGIVSRALSLATSYGIHAFVDHFNGWQTRYAHMMRLAVRSGQQVVAGQVLGWVDNTGNSFGNHLHIEFLRGGVKVRPEAIGFDDGYGTLLPGMNLAYNGTGRPETLAAVGGDGVDLSGETLNALRQLLAGSGGDTFNVDMTVSVDDLARMGRLADFIDMLDGARVSARRTQRSGTVVD